MSDTSLSLADYERAYYDAQPTESINDAIVRFQLEAPHKKAMPRVRSWVAGIGNSIELGGGGDAQGPFGFGRPSNSSAINIACGASDGLLPLLANRGIGGDTMGGWGELTATATAGETTLHIRPIKGTAYPFTGQSLFIGGYRGANYEARITHSSCTSETTPTELTTALTYTHPVGTKVYWGVMGRFNDYLQGIGDPDLGVGGIFPGIVHFHIGTNDLRIANSGLTDDQFEAAFRALDALAKAIPSKPFVVWDTIIPRTNLNSSVMSWNGKIRLLAQELGSAVADVHRVLVNPSNGAFRTDFAGGALTWDGIHPNQQGAQLMAQVQLHTMLELVGTSAAVPAPFVSSYFDQFSLLPDSTFQTLENAGVGVNGFPDGWDVLTTSGAATGYGNPFTLRDPDPSDFLDGKCRWCDITIPAGANGIIGFKTTMSPTAGVGGSPLAVASAEYPGWEPLDWLFLAVKVQADQGFDGTGKVSYTCQVQRSDGFTLDLAVEFIQAWDGWMYQVIQIPAGVTELVFRMAVEADGTSVVPAVVSFAQPTAYNMTKGIEAGVFG